MKVRIEDARPKEATTLVDGRAVDGRRIYDDGDQAASDRDGCGRAESHPAGMAAALNGRHRKRDRHAHATE